MGGIDRSGKSDVRQRRAFQALGAGDGFIFGNGLIYDPDTGEITLNLLAPNLGGLKFTGSGALTIALDPTAGNLASLSSNGLYVASGTLDSLTDVMISSPAAGETIVWNGVTQWQNRKLDFNDLGDGDLLQDPGDVLMVEFADTDRVQTTPLFDSDLHVKAEVLPGSMLLFLHERFI